ncbi:hypothetical protein [Labrys sp. ZIDIC5]|uniref:hypothetical protein n=1 Tax=Labrys sedimenti TaxID=3106036 RepID=UPI002ACA19EF|nr:hypothetical protein [Labrys sp. ZIDIC5]MDZ5448940.1 hypothetical protein [Labrys sp. ZIDIC5]
MPTEQEKRKVVANWLVKENIADPALANLLAPAVTELFCPEPKRISIEHWQLIAKKAGPTEKPE